MTNFQVREIHKLLLPSKYGRLLDVHWTLELKFMRAEWTLCTMMYTRCWVDLDVQISRIKGKVCFVMLCLPY